MEDRSTIQQDTRKRLRQDDEDGSSIDTLVANQFPEKAESYERSIDLNIGVKATLDERSVLAVVTKRYDDKTASVKFLCAECHHLVQAEPCSEFEVKSESAIQLYTSTNPRSEFQLDGELETTFLTALLQAANVGKLHRPSPPQE